MTPDELLDAEGSIRHRLDRGWRIGNVGDGDLDGWWWVPREHHSAATFMRLTEAEESVWESLRSGPVALRPKETR